MRIRHNPQARPALEACPFFVSRPETLRGRWAEQFDSARPLHLELGCGKGEFIAQMLSRQPEVNYVAVDIKDEVLFLAMRAVLAARAEIDRQTDNLRLTAFDIERIRLVFGPEDRVERLYINFPNPWPKARHQKHRLVHPRQLEQYRSFLSPGGELYFRTDNLPLFEDGLAALEEAGFASEFITYDLLDSPYAHFPDSEHQRMFTAKGLPIYFVIARRST
jgi:tRNA (guanine-N7-)-methyltransferase